MTSTMRIARNTLLPVVLAATLMCLSEVSWGAAGIPGGSANAAAGQDSIQLKGKEFKNVNVTVSNGVATLTGTVNLYEYKDQAAKKALHTSGVKGVRNEIQVAGPNMSDEELQKKLAPALANNRVGYGNVFDAITLEVHNGTVVLGGHCHDYPNRNAAVALVDSTPGVKNVIDHIQVDPVSTVDWQIRRAEERAIYGYPALNRYAINPEKPIRISVQNGHVELYGTVDSPADKQMAYMQASQVPGVFSVKNYLQVEGQPSQPTEPR